jgi:threonine/homoserine/homoserine lactone efflux protein
MDPYLYLAFVIATAALVAIPGPTVLLVTSVALRRGPRAGLTAVAGSTSAAAAYVAVIVAGLTPLVALLSDAFGVLRWLGVAYLVYLGVQAWRGSDARGDAAPDPRGAALRSFGQGFLTTLTNPKLLLFLTAFFPQFVDPSAPLLPQFLLLGVSFVVLLGALDACWVLAASAAGARLRSPIVRRYCDRAAGSLLLAGAAYLALERRS